MVNSQTDKNPNVGDNPSDFTNDHQTLNMPPRNTFASVAADFDGDGVEDLVFGHPFEFGTPDDPLEGFVEVVSDLHKGSTKVKKQILHNHLPRLASRGGVTEFNYFDEYGTSLAVGDFNNDGHSDLVVGAPGLLENSGGAQFFYGSDNGLRTDLDSVFARQSVSTRDDARLGYAAAVGDFNGDGFHDAALGAPGEKIGTAKGAGLVQIFRGSSNRFDQNGTRRLSQDSWGNGAEAGENLGHSVATGDFNGDGFDDLAAAAPYKDINGKKDAGAVNVVFGSQYGLTATGNQIWHQDISGVQGTSEAGDNFGWWVVVGNFNGDKYHDLAVSIPFKDINGKKDAGAVQILLGSKNGLTATGNQIWHQDISGIGGTSGAGEHFGYKAVTGNFDKNGSDDLAISIPGKTINGVTDAGAVMAIYGSREKGLAAVHSNGLRNELWHQDIVSRPGVATKGARYGSFMTMGDFNGSGFQDLNVGTADNPRLDIINGSAIGLI